ncbi:MAG: DMT family transporter [Hyphomonadaceae bacterium]|nr:DMT family transporter [Hyphomonadaceae bacterium]
MSFGAQLRLVLVMALWASCFPLIALGLELAPLLAFAALRAAIGGIALIGVAVLLRCPMPKGQAAWGMIVLLALSATSLGFLGMFHGAAFLSPGIATLIFSTQPLAAALLGRLFFGRTIEPAGRWPGPGSGIAARRAKTCTTICGRSGFVRQHKRPAAGGGGLCQWAAET